MEKKIIEEYTVSLDKVTVPIRIIKEKGSSPIYNILLPKFAPATEALLDSIRSTLILEVKVTSQEILDPKVIDSLKKKFYEKTINLITKRLPQLPEARREVLAITLLNEMVGLGEVEFLLNDGFLEEIVINSVNEPIRIYHKKHGWLETNITPKSEAQIQNISNIIARRVGRQITTLNPLLDAHLVTGDRANAVLYPIANKGHTVTIRKFARDPWTVTDFITNKTVSSEMMALIWTVIQYEMNILISGGTASGKTSLLNVCMPFMPPNHRILSIEDTRELMLPKYLYWCPLTTRQPNPEGKGEVTMLDLLVNSLRMRPDRIVLGEMRRKREAEVLFEAMHTGHSVYATVHADSLNETVSRLVNPPIEVPKNLMGAINLNVVMFRDRRRGIRRIFQAGEFIVSEKGDVRTNLLHRWDPTKDAIVKHSKPIKLFEELSRHTGLNEIEINKDIRLKKQMLEYLVKKKIRQVEKVGAFMHEFYTDESSLIKKIRAR